MSKRSKAAAVREAARKRQRNRTIAIVIILVVLVVGILATAIGLVYQHFFVDSLNSYDAQMRIAADAEREGDLDKAEEAYRKALSFQAGDLDATLALAELLVKTDRPDEGAGLYEELLAKDEGNTGYMERLLSIYVEGMEDMDKANGMIIRAYEAGLELSSNLIAPPPELSPKGGTFTQTTKVTLTAPDGYTIHYTNRKADVPTPADKEYKKPFSLSKNRSFYVHAAVFDERGLMGWPVYASYKIRLQFIVDTSAVKHLGRTAGSIMEDIGPLFFTEEFTEGGGAIYEDENGRFRFVFFLDAYAQTVPVAPTTTDTAITGASVTGAAVAVTETAVKSVPFDPLTSPLPVGAKCEVIYMDIASYLVQQRGSFRVKDLMAGLEIEQYAVRSEPFDGKYHLYYDIDGVRFDLKLRDEGTVDTKDTMELYLVEPGMQTIEDMIKEISGEPGQGTDSALTTQEEQEE
ncbi:MAG: chitobiase/beta-hexosaminidase C-terminal domain-containing protein [Clostridiales Family XIII bacterium]|jgi:tetratricopeptide (TPR) repeat protein|nr:chitobiase/beta-hexosaminidase C-terminal domain-containing protein [Clostridiales Family XIII bacterium]